MATRTEQRGEAERSARTHDPEGVKRDILTVARAEFARKGYSGARVDEIAAQTRTSKRMIYYYFGDKDGLYVAVLEDVYREMRGVESGLDIERLDPVLALSSLVGFTFDYQAAHPDFVRIVMSENILEAEHMRRSKALQSLNVPAIEALRRILSRGEAAGVFRAGLDPVDLHMTISALSFFNVSNRPTFSTIFKVDMASPAAHAVRRSQVIDVVLRYVRG